MKTMNLFNSIASEIGITYHNSIPTSEMQKITQSSAAYDLLRSIWNDQIELYESFYVLYMNRANKVLGYRCISQGGISGTVVDPKAVFQAALLANASSLIMAHNHPSGNMQPSEADNKLTKKLIAAGKVLDIDVLDHLILDTNNFYSYADQGQMN
ncbi:MAG: JAB domain-containing protein [Bacteroidetes bacterium]|nr:JAB domain-containing protein [Bacteroidota bacterium]